MNTPSNLVLALPLVASLNALAGCQEVKLNPEVANCVAAIRNAGNGLMFDEHISPEVDRVETIQKVDLSKVTCPASCDVTPAVNPLSPGMTSNHSFTIHCPSKPQPTIGEIQSIEEGSL